MSFNMTLNSLELRKKGGTMMTIIPRIFFQIHDLHDTFISGKSIIKRIRKFDSRTIPRPAQT
jgi:hypothetical protein